MEQKTQEKIHIVILLVAAFFVVAWTINPVNGLLFDDYALLAKARFWSYKDLLTLIPTTGDRDGSLWLVILKIMIQKFGDHYVAYHLFFVAIHLWNVYLVYRIAIIIMKRFGRKHVAEYAFVTAAIFGVNPNTLFAMEWIAATADLFSCNLLLLALYGYLKTGEEQKTYTAFWGAFALGFYWLSLRCSVISLPFPLFLFAYEIALAMHEKKKVKNILFPCIGLLLMALYAGLLVRSGKHDLVWEHILLSLKNYQYRSHWYLPSVAVAFLPVPVVDKAAKLFKIENKSAVCAVVLIICCLMNYIPGLKDFKAWWLVNAQKDAEAVHSIERLCKPPRMTHYYLVQKQPGDNLFSYGPGNVLNLVFDDPTLSLDVVETFPEDPESPYVFVILEGETVEEVERSEEMDSKIGIAQLSKYEVDSGGAQEEFNIGLVLDLPYNTLLQQEYRFEDMTLRLNGEEIPFVQGKEFISFTIPENMRQSGSLLEVTLYSEQAGGESEPAIIKVI